LTIDLERALASGRGVERPFRCHEHKDHTASASVNSYTGLWFCHACGAKGKVDPSEPPQPDVILGMLSLGQDSRSYPLAWLNLFDTVPSEYWLERFPDPNIVRLFRLGVHPTTRCPTFPVFEGPDLSNLAGIGTRLNRTGARYVYPSGFTASKSFGVPVSPFPPHQVVVLVEGIADAVALAMSGVTAWACWGAGLHFPQVQLLMDFGVEHILLGFDSDETGQRAAKQALNLRDIYGNATILGWPEGIKDPAEMPPGNTVADWVRCRVPPKYQGVFDEQRNWWLDDH
jgi:hypothetical protein